MKYKESDTQIACVQWFRLQFPEFAKLLIAIPNGGKRNIITAKVMKAEGVVAGASDLILLVPKHRYGCLCIEMKTKTGVQSENQKQWQKDVEKFGNRYVICRNVDEFIIAVNSYLIAP